VAPLAATIATIAATVAAGIGVAIARAARERHGVVPRAPDPNLGLHRGERLAEGMQRMAIDQVDVAINLLERSATGAVDERTVHETRKSLKRLRALLRLLRAELGEDVFARENAALRDIAARLSSVRDAEVMLATLHALIERYPRQLAHRRGVEKLLAQLAAEHERVQRQTLGKQAARREVLDGLRHFRARAGCWQLPDRRRSSLIEPGLGRIYRQGRRRYRRAQRSTRHSVATMHAWRKRVKDLRYAVEVLEWREAHASAGKPSKGRRRKGKRVKGAQAGRLRAIARRADELGELLGEDHDLAVLAQTVQEAHSKRTAGALRVGAGTRKTLLKVIAHRRRELRRRALREGARLYASSPKGFVGRVRRAHQGARRQLS
jgi:CHAD domain-containing protein